MNPSVQAAVNSALASLQEETPVTATKVGDRQFETKVQGAITEVSIERNRQVAGKREPGNISPSEFDRVW